MEQEKPTSLPAQHQDQHPGKEYKMDPEPMYMAPWHKGSGKLKDKVAIITGGDSGIGRSVAVLFGREGAKVVVCYFSSEKDAQKTKELVENEHAECIIVQGDLKLKKTAEEIVQKTVDKFGKVDILVNNAAVQYYHENIEEITEEQLDETFRSNIFSQFFMVQAALKHMKSGSSIINTSSVTAFQGNPTLLDYSATKGAIMAFTRSLALTLASKGIRVNAVCPGPIWTPFIPSSFPAEKVKDFGKSSTLGRPGQPEECSPAYVFLASEDASYITGQAIHPNGGSIVNA